jgi:hypothetical protein
MLQCDFRINIQLKTDALALMEEEIPRFWAWIETYSGK